MPTNQQQKLQRHLIQLQKNKVTSRILTRLITLPILRSVMQKMYKHCWNYTKNWDNNTLDNSKSAFAENDTMYFSDGNMFAGSRDSLFIIANKMRGQMGSVVDSIHAWVPLRSKDKKDQWVAIWAREISTNAKGIKKSKELHEVWRFDNNGKINLVYQYEQQPPKMPPPQKK